MRRDIFEPEHDDFRATARSFYETVCVPHTDEWEQRGYVDREAWLEAGKLGLIGWELPERYGGAGIKDFRFNATEMTGGGTPARSASLASSASTWRCVNSRGQSRHLSATEVQDSSRPRSPRPRR